MDILGIGPLELFFIVIIALIVLGPNDMVKAGRTLGRFMRTIIMSDTWRTIRRASDDIRNLPNRLMREAGIEEDELRKELNLAETIRKEIDPESIHKEIDEVQEGIAEWTTPPNSIAPPKQPPKTDLKDDAPIDEWITAPLPEEAEATQPAEPDHDIPQEIESEEEEQQD
jgi:Sec-independent protein translocase protein TatA